MPPHVPKIGKRSSPRHDFTGDVTMPSGEPGDCHYFDEYGEPPDNPDKNEIDDSLFHGF